CEHSPVFIHVPTESAIRAKQRAYYEALAACDRAGDATTFVDLSLGLVKESLVAFMEAFRPSREDADARLDAAHHQFGSRLFSRKGSLALHKGISTATASRDLRDGVARDRLRMQGTRATARYCFAGGASSTKSRPR